MRISPEYLEQIQKRNEARESKDKPVFNRRWSPAQTHLQSDLSWLRSELEGQDVHILGSGASLYGIDWSQFNGKKTIVVNNTIRWCHPKPTVHVFLDTPVLQEGGLGDCPVVTKIGNQFTHSHPIHYINLGNRFTADPIRNGFYSHYSTAHVALSLAIFCRAKRILAWGLEQMFYDDKDFEFMEVFAKNSLWYQHHDFLAERDRIKAKGGNFGHFYSSHLAHRRDTHEKPYRQAGNTMTVYADQKNIYSMTPIHNTPFPYIEVDP